MSDSEQAESKQVKGSWLPGALPPAAGTAEGRLPGAGTGCPLEH